MNREKRAESVALFRDQWALYRKVVERDYMGHEAILARIRELLRNRPPAQRLLDLACGDACLAARYLPGATVSEYHGVDLAHAPLDLASSNLRGCGTRCVFHLSDQSQFLSTTRLSFDLVVFGFALHHSPGEGKRRALADIRRLLRPGGELWLYDTFMRPGQTRGHYLDAYLGTIRSDWKEVTPDEFASIEAHIRGNDFPATLDEILALGREVGFSTVEDLLATNAGFHHLLRFAT